MRRTFFFIGIMVVSLACAHAADEPDEFNPPPGQADPTAIDLREMQGRWEREYANPQGVIFRVEKVVEGNKDTLTEFDANGNVMHSHGSDFTLKRDGPVRVYTFSNSVVTAGPRTGERRAGPISFLYRIEKGRMFEVWGLLDGDRCPFAVLVWRRPKE